MSGSVIFRIGGEKADRLSLILELGDLLLERLVGLVGA